MLLYVEPPAFDLVTAGSESLAAIAYCSLAIPGSFSIDYSATSSSLITGTLPSLHDDDSGIWLAGLSEIQAHLARIGLELDGEISREAAAESTAYSQLMSSTAQNVTLLYLFDDEENYSRFSQHGHSRFPYNYLSTTRYLKKVTARLDELKGQEAQDPKTQGFFGSSQTARVRQKARQMKVQNMADPIYAILENKLSHSPYLCGQKPSSIDCTVLGYLSFHLFSNVPNNFLARRIQESFPRTWKYLVDLRDLIFEQAKIEILEHKAASPKELLSGLFDYVSEHWTTRESAASTSEHQETKQTWQQKAAFASAMIGVLGLFIWSNKLIVVDFSDDAEHIMEEVS